MPETSPKPFVFVLMPFDEIFADIYQYGIKAACRDAGGYCERVDEQIFVENILERVYNQIAKADIIIAEMTGRNPNVFYEVGYAHALNKRVILLTQKTEDIPFDLQHYPHVVYDGKISLLKPELEKRVQWCIDNPERALSKISLDLEFTANGRVLVEAEEQEISVGLQQMPDSDPGETEFQFRIRLGIHNKGEKILDSDSYQLGLVSTPAVIWVNHDDPRSAALRSIRYPGGHIYRLPKFGTLFPDGWEGIDLVVGVDLQFQKLEETRLTLRHFTELGPRDFPLRVVRPR